MTIRFGKMIVDASTSLLVLFTFDHVPDGKSVAWFRFLKKNPSIRNKQGSVLARVAWPGLRSRLQ